jgi:hypothetical protein
MIDEDPELRQRRERKERLWAEARQSARRETRYAFIAAGILILVIGGVALITHSMSASEYERCAKTCTREHGRSVHPEIVGGECFCVQPPSTVHKTH